MLYEPLKEAWTFARNNYSTIRSFRKNELVVSGGVLYRSKEHGNLNNPVMDTDWWEPNGDPNAPTGNGNIDKFEPVLPRNQWLWTGGASGTGIAVLIAQCRPDQWAEQETDAGNLGPIVRGDAASDTMYYATVRSEGEAGEMVYYVDLYRRVNGLSVLLQSYPAGYDTVNLPQATRLCVYSYPPKFRIAVRQSISGEGAGYDPWLEQLDQYPFLEITPEPYVDNSPDAIATGQIGTWGPSPGAEGTSHISYSDFEYIGPRTITFHDPPSVDELTADGAMISYIVEDFQLAGASTGVSDTTGALVTGITLAGTSDGLSSATGTLTAPGAVRPTLTFVGQPQVDQLTATGAVISYVIEDFLLAGVSTGISDAVGTIIIPDRIELSGSSTGSSDAVGTLIVPAEITLAGSSVGSSQAVASLLTPVKTSTIIKNIGFVLPYSRRGCVLSADEKGFVS